MKISRKKNRSKKLPQKKKESFFEKDQKNESDNHSFFTKNNIQAKLNIGKADDPFEKEADQMAQQVVKNQEASSQLNKGQQVQKQGTEEEEAQAKRQVQKKEEEEMQAKRKIQRMEEEEEAQPKRMIQKKEEEEMQAKRKIQRMEEEEEAQPKRMIQKKEEEEMQAKRKIQRMEEEEEAQPKRMIQKKEEEEMQAKRKIQRMEEEEEAQPKRMIQKKEEEEMQAKRKIQRMEEEEEAQPKRMIQKMEEEEMQAKTIRRKEKEDTSFMQSTSTEPIQKKESDTASPEIEEVLAKSKGKGQALPEDVRKEMETSFEADFSKVMIHTGPDAIQMTQALNAFAFTHGNDIYFNEGQFQPYSSTGKELLAHELTHVVQQND